MLSFRKLIKFCFIFVLLVQSISGCVKWQGALGIDTDFRQAAYSGVDQLLLNTKEPLSPDTSILVASLVNIDSMQQSSTFGRTMAEYINAGFVYHDFITHEVKLRQNLYIREETGELLLSREISEISKAHNAQAVVVGTYSLGEYIVYVSLRLVRADDNFIMSTAQINIPLGVEARQLLKNDRLY